MEGKSWSENVSLGGGFFMGKDYKFEMKLKIVEEYLNSSLGYKRLSKKYNVCDDCLVERWVKEYLEWGGEGLDKKMKNTSYTTDFKVSLLTFTQQNQFSYPQTPNHFKITNPPTLPQSHPKFHQQPILPLHNKHKPHPSKIKTKHTKLQHQNHFPLKQHQPQQLQTLTNQNQIFKPPIPYQKNLQTFTQHYPTKHPKN